MGIPANLAQLNKVDPADFAALAELALHDTCMSDVYKRQPHNTVPFCVKHFRIFHAALHRFRLVVRIFAVHRCV